jgi:holo-[acyl-carrier protein] synthase
MDIMSEQSMKKEKIRVGIDLTAIDEVAHSVERFGTRYLKRLFTEHEQACCQGEPRTVAAGLAARFAAKEATLKVLRPVGAQPEWTSIEVQRDPGGWCHLHLTRSAAEMAERQGITDLTVSLTHEAGFAAAVVVAVCGQEE